MARANQSEPKRLAPDSFPTTQRNPMLIRCILLVCLSSHNNRGPPGPATMPVPSRHANPIHPRALALEPSNTLLLVLFMPHALPHQPEPVLQDKCIHDETKTNKSNKSDPGFIKTMSGRRSTVTLRPAWPGTPLQASPGMQLLPPVTPKPTRPTDHIRLRAAIVRQEPFSISSWGSHRPLPS